MARTRHLRAARALLALALFALALPASASTVRLKELTSVQGVRDNQLFGYGLVVGLAGTGDTEQVIFTAQAVAAMLGRFGARIDKRDIRVRNVAAVMVTARLPAFARPGTRIDVNVGSMGNARSLAGGTLLLTPLSGPDGAVYAVAQGALQAGGTASRRSQPTSALLPEGATVEKAVATDLGKGPLVLQLRQHDFTTANRIATAINLSLKEPAARALDPAAVEVKVPTAFADNLVGLLAQLEILEVDADQRALVVVSERTGTVVAGERVRIRPVAVAHGGLQILIREQPATPPGSLPPHGRPWSGVPGPRGEDSSPESGRGALALAATGSVEELVKALNLLGATPRDLIAILEAMHAAGALDADLEVQ
jgi:flagellar P-ring protein precursor FlgI